MNRNSPPLWLLIPTGTLVVLTICGTIDYLSKESSKELNNHRDAILTNSLGMGGFFVTTEDLTHPESWVIRSNKLGEYAIFHAGINGMTRVEGDRLMTQGPFTSRAKAEEALTSLLQYYTNKFKEEDDAVWR